MTSFLALYRGDSVATADLITLTADPEVVRDFADRMLSNPPPRTGDPARDAIRGGRVRALELVRDDADDDEHGRNGERSDG